LNNKEFDGVVTMYHDQGQIAIKLVGFAIPSRFPLGCRTRSPRRRTARATKSSGKNKAITSTFEDAYVVACRMAVTDRAGRNNLMHQKLLFLRSFFIVVLAPAAKMGCRQHMTETRGRF
jgi:hypothetical protein